MVRGEGGAQGKHATAQRSVLSQHKGLRSAADRLPGHDRAESQQPAHLT
jgi:hypothetical protein